MAHQRFGGPRWQLGQDEISTRSHVVIDTPGGTVPALLSTPEAPRGWVLVAAGCRDDRFDAARAARAFNRLQLGALTFDFSSTNSSETLLAAHRWLAAERAGGLPIGLAASGTAADGVLQVASMLAGTTPALVLWNARLSKSVAHDPVRVPTLLLLDRDRGRRGRRAHRRVRRQLGPLADLIVTDQLARRGHEAIGHWYAGSAGQRPLPAHRRAAAQVSPRRLALTAAVGLASAALPLVAQASAGSRTIRPHQIVGDGFGSAAVPATEPAQRSRRFSGRLLGSDRVHGDGIVPGRLSRLFATGSIGLVDGNGVKYFVNTNITFSTTSSASGAMSEASFQHATAASTSAGGTTASTLNDGFDGYHDLAVHVGSTVPGPPQTGNANFDIYDRVGSSPVLSCSGQQVDFPVQHQSSGIDVSREVFVPSSGGSYARWLDSFTNTTASALTVTAYTANNLGSDSNTTITATSSGDTTATTGDNWVASFQNWSGNTSSDPREGHVVEGPNARVGLSEMHFVNGDDNPYWDYVFTVPAGKTVGILNYVVLRGTQAAAASGASSIVSSPPTTCMTASEKSEVANFNLGTKPAAPMGQKSADVAVSDSASATSATVGDQVTYTLTATNNGPEEATDVQVSDALPAGADLVSVSSGVGTCEGTTSLMCSLGSLEAGDSATITVVAKLTQAGDNTDQVGISTDRPDPDQSNQRASTTVSVTAGSGGAPPPVTAGADLGVTGTVLRLANGNLRYSFSVGNLGPADATGVTLKTKLRRGGGWLVTAPAGCREIGSLVCPIGALGSGAQKTLTVVIRPRGAGEYENDASVSGDQPDPIPANDTAKVSVRVKRSGH